MKNANLMNFGSLFCFYLFEIKANNIEKAKGYYNELKNLIDDIKVSKHIEIFKSDCLKEFLDVIINENKQEKIINILKNDLVKQTVFDDYYKDLLETLEK
jgi:hypothetical protein